VIPSPARLEELRGAVLALGVPPDVVATLETELADDPLELARCLIDLRDGASLKRRMELGGLREREPEFGGSEWEANRPDPVRQ
jgi:hypothetical protein